MVAPLLSGSFFYKIVCGEKVLLGNGYIELFTDELGNHRYFLNGLLHREDGPAIVCKSGYKEWYIRGRQIHPAWLETRKDELLTEKDKQNDS